MRGKMPTEGAQIGASMRRTMLPLKTPVCEYGIYLTAPASILLNPRSRYETLSPHLKELAWQGMWESEWDLYPARFRISFRELCLCV